MKLLKVKITTNACFIPKGTIIEVHKCGCGDCKFDLSNPDDISYYKLIDKDTKDKYHLTEVNTTECEVLTTKVNHLPDWM